MAIDSQVLIGDNDHAGMVSHARAQMCCKLYGPRCRPMNQPYPNLTIILEGYALPKGIVTDSGVVAVLPPTLTSKASAERMRSPSSSPCPKLDLGQF